MVSQLQCGIHIHIGMWEDFRSRSTIRGPEMACWGCLVAVLGSVLCFVGPGIKPRAVLSCVQPLESWVCVQQ